jgi:hypothetical protein
VTPQDERLTIMMKAVCGDAPCSWPHCGSRACHQRESHARDALRSLDAHDKAERVARPWKVTGEMVEAAAAAFRKAWAKSGQFDDCMPKTLEAALLAAPWAVPAAQHPYTTNRGYGAEGTERTRAACQWCRNGVTQDGSPCPNCGGSTGGARQRELDAEVADAAKYAADHAGPSDEPAWLALAAAFRHRAGEAEAGDEHD